MAAQASTPRTTRASGVDSPISSRTRCTSAASAGVTGGPAGSGSVTAPASYASCQSRTRATMTRVPGPVVRSAGAW